MEGIAFIRLLYLRGWLIGNTKQLVDRHAEDLLEADQILYGWDSLVLLPQADSLAADIRAFCQRFL